MSSYILGEAARIGIPKMVFLNMVVNVAIEAVVGTILIAGNIFDITWKANLRNVQLEKYIEHPKKTKTSYTFFTVDIIFILLVCFVLMAIFGVYILRWCWLRMTGSG